MNLSDYIDHTCLKPDATISDIEKLCKEAIEYHFASVCVHPYYVPFAKKALENSSIAIGTVVGFPLGMNTKEVKVYEAIEAVNEGADEIDMVINIGALKDKDYDYIKEEIEEIRDAIDGKILKVIIETCYLTEEEIMKMTKICNETYVHFIKTSTGFGPSGAKEEDVKIIMKNKNEVLEVKASGGIRTEEDMMKLIHMGVKRIGTSASVAIMKGGKK